MIQRAVIQLLSKIASEPPNIFKFSLYLSFKVFKFERGEEAETAKVKSHDRRHLTETINRVDMITKVKNPKISKYAMVARIILTDC